jgi:hypothetical protein
MTRRLGLAASLYLVACGSSQAHWNASSMERLPLDSRRVVYERENEVTIALNRRDDAQQTIERLEEERAGLDERQKRAESRLARTGGDRSSRVRRVIDARRDWIEAQLEAARAAQQRTEGDLELARARLHTSRQQQLARMGLAPETSVAPFTETEKACEREAQKLEKRELDVRTTGNKAFERWKQAEDDYAQATGDYDALVWID